MPCTKPDSLRDDQTKSPNFGAQADGRKEEQLETSLAVQPNDMTGKHRDEEHNPLEQPQVSEKEDKDKFTIGGGGDVTYFSPFGGGTARKYPLPEIYLTNPLVKCDEFGASLPIM